MLHPRRHPRGTRSGPPHRGTTMDTIKIATDPGATRLRRVGRLARRRMRLDGAALANGSHSDGIVTIEISGLGSPSAGAPDTFEWKADRPIALVIVRSGIDGE